MKKKGIRVGSDFVSLVVGFVLGFLIAFTYSWKTIMYIIGVLLEQ